MEIVFKIRTENELVTGIECQRLELVVRSLVNTISPSLGGKGTRIIIVGRFGVGIHLHLATIVQLMFFIRLTPKFVFNGKLRNNRISGLLLPSEVGNSHRVTVGYAVTQVVRSQVTIVGYHTSCRSCGRHDVIITR